MDAKTRKELLDILAKRLNKEGNRTDMETLGKMFNEIVVTIKPPLPKPPIVVVCRTKKTFRIPVPKKPNYEMINDNIDRFLKITKSLNKKNGYK